MFLRQREYDCRTSDFFYQSPEHREVSFVFRCINFDEFQMEDPERFEIKLSPQTESILVSIRVSKKQEHRVFVYVTT